MIYIGIDVAKDKHDCFITNSDSEVLFKAFTIFNNLDGFNDLYQKIESVMDDVTKVKVGLEATGHYSYNLLGYLIDKGLPTYVIPLLPCLPAHDLNRPGPPLYHRHSVLACMSPMYDAGCEIPHPAILPF